MISVGIIKDPKIYFATKKAGEIIYIQVAYFIPDNKIKEREFGNLLRINNNQSKLVVSMNSFSIVDFNGIKHMLL